MPPARTAHPAPASRAPTPLWKRLFSAQESGLVIVIILIMAALTWFGGTKQAPVSVEIPAGATVEERGDRELVIRTSDGRETVHVSDSGWRIPGAEGQARAAFGRRTVNAFFEKGNLVQQTTTASFIAIMAVGMTGIIILAGIDISIGSIYALAAMLAAMALSRFGPEASIWTTVPTAILIACAVGAVCGFLNGSLSVGLRVHPFVITLGTMAVFRGLVFVLSQGQTVSGLPDSLQQGFFKLEYSGVYPIPTLIMLLVAGAGMFILARTVFGRRVYAIGGNETAAKYAGIPVARIKVLVFTLAGLLAGLSAAMYIGYFGAAESNAGAGYELKVIAAAVIGGASLSGGRGSAVGAVLGAIMVQLIDNGMIILGIDQSYNQIVMGTAIILAVAVDQAKLRLSGR
jgi:ribose/xylose/arabinose/galactoside ABC-type transport system permease subunit